MAWIVLLYRLPANDSRARVAVWRELRRSGALHVQQSVVAVPDDDRFSGVVERLRAVLADVGGQVTALRSEPVDGGDDGRLVEAWNAARTAEYRELAGESAKFLAEIDHEFEIEKFTLAELDEEEQNVERLRRWHRELHVRDRFAAGDQARMEQRLDECGALLARFTDLVYNEVGLS
jgi:hypothetical protein